MRHLALLHESLDEGRHKHMVEVAEEGEGKQGTEVSVGPTTKLSVGEDEGKGGGRGEKVGCEGEGEGEEEPTVVCRRALGCEWGGGADLRIAGRVARCASSASDLERESIGRSSAKRGAGQSKAVRGSCYGRQGAAGPARRCQDGACARAAMPPHESLAALWARHEDGAVRAWRGVARKTSVWPGQG